MGYASPDQQGWERVLSKGEVAKSAIAGVIAGASGGTLGVSIASWLADDNKILGATWWEATTSLGTVGAAFFAAWSAYHGFRDRVEQRSRTRYFVLGPKENLIEQLVIDLPEIYRVIRSKFEDEPKSHGENASYENQVEFIFDLSGLEITSSDESVLEVRDAKELNKIRESAEFIRADLLKLLNASGSILSPLQLISMVRIERRCRAIAGSFVKLFPERRNSDRAVVIASENFRDWLTEVYGVTF